jgi:predicted metalloprotease with PDZ domain
MSDPIRYIIVPKNPGAHLFEVTVVVRDPDEAGQLFRVPAWIPGSYLVRDFARNVVGAAANCDGVPIGLTKVDKSTWQADACAGPLTLVFEVYAYDLSVRGAHLDHTHAYFNGPAVFPAVVGQEHLPCELDIRPPATGTGRDWRVATSMTSRGAERYGYGTYEAADYWELIDHPVEIGDLHIGEFEVDGIPHAIAARGHDTIDLARICRDLTTVCEQHHKLLGAPSTLDRYLFLLTVVDKGYGGLEHRWSSSLICGRDDLPRPGKSAVSEAYRKFLGLCSHEYFHLWNVTRMKPAAFTPYDLADESYTGLLWVFEGITSYYDDLTLVRSGVITPESYLELLGQTITRVLRAPGRLRQSVEESSFDAWTKFYKQDVGSPNFIVSYYAKGSLIALALDLTIRRMTGDEYSLDDVVRECWKRYGETGEGMPERGLESVVRDVCDIDLDDFFERYVRGTTDIPLDQPLLDAGVRLNLRPADNAKDKGGKPSGEDARPVPWLGAALNVADGKSVFGTVIAGSPAERAGLAPGDEAVALNELRIDAQNLEARLSEFSPGDRVRLDVFRRDQFLRLSVTLAEPPADTCYLVSDEAAEAAAARRRAAWLSGDVVGLAV